MNTYGDRFRLTTYGESHGLAVGAIIDGCAAGLTVDMAAIEAALTRRRGEGAFVTARKEADEVVFLSGLKDGVTLGTPIAFEIRNSDAKPEDYEALRDCCRPGHADYTYLKRYGTRDERGGGRASARETAARVVAGAIARQMLPGVEIKATAQAGHCAEDDTCGGTVSCRVTGLRAGVGNPMFGKLNAQLAAAMFSIPSVIGFEMGSGFAAAQMSGSEYVDRWSEEGDGSTRTNHCGGVQGGISNGMPVEFRVAFHPVATLPRPVECLGSDGSLKTVNAGGRHDRCQVMRAPVIVESMAALCLVNLI